MGNTLTCVPSKKELRGGVGPRSKRGQQSQRRMPAEEELMHRQALAMAIHQHQLSQRFSGSMSRQIGSTSSRRMELPESLCNGKQTFLTEQHNQYEGSRRGMIMGPVLLDKLETKKIVLVHGEGFGAWCWYKIIPLLEEVGLQPVALDLKGSGIDHTETSSIKCLSEYTKPLIDYLDNLPPDEKVILVGHSCGGASISYALEAYPKKISKAIFVCATMIMDGQRSFDMFADELASAEIFMQESKLLLFGNGRDQSPTGLVLDKEQIKGLYFNQSPSKDIALAMVSMRPIPLVPVMEKLILTQENYGSVRRFYIQTLDDHMLSPDIQEKMVRENPPHGVYKIKGSDHCPFFSKPQSLNKFLLES